MKNITINFQNNTIDISKSFEKKARVYGSYEYDQLCNARIEFPDFRLNIIEPSKKKNQFKGLNYEYMADYIQKCNRDDKDKIMEEFRIISGYDKDAKKRDKKEKTEVASYLEVKEWFLKKFPEIEDYRKSQREKIDEILNAA